MSDKFNNAMNFNGALKPARSHALIDKRPPPPAAPVRNVAVDMGVHLVLVTALTLAMAEAFARSVDDGEFEKFLAAFAAQGGKMATQYSPPVQNAVAEQRGSLTAQLRAARERGHVG
jgi:hypothetical protein